MAVLVLPGERGHLLATATALRRAEARRMAPAPLPWECMELAMEGALATWGGIPLPARP